MQGRHRWTCTDTELHPLCARGICYGKLKPLCTYSSFQKGAWMECTWKKKDLEWRAVTTNIKCRLHEGLRLHSQKHPALGSLCLNLEGWLLMLQKDRGAERYYRRQIVQFIFHPCLHNSPAQTITLFDSLSHFLHCHNCLAPERASLVMLYSVGLCSPSSLRSRSQVFGNTSVHCTCNAIGF